MKIVFVLILLGFFSCSKGQERTTKTPEKFKTIRQINPLRFSNDSLKMVTDLSCMLIQHKNFFYSYNSRYVDTLKSELMIDTLIFNDDLEEKAIILATTKYLFKEYFKVINNETVNLGPKVLFDGYCIFAKKKENEWKYYSYYIKIGKYFDNEECKNRLKEIYLLELSTLNEINYNMFNIDDSRIWTQPIWDKF